MSWYAPILLWSFLSPAPQGFYSAYPLQELTAPSINAPVVDFSGESSWGLYTTSTAISYVDPDISAIFVKERPGDGWWDAMDARCVIVFERRHDDPERRKKLVGWLIDRNDGSIRRYVQEDPYPNWCSLLPSN